MAAGSGGWGAGPPWASAERDGPSDPAIAAQIEVHSPWLRNCTAGTNFSVRLGSQCASGGRLTTGWAAGRPPNRCKKARPRMRVIDTPRINKIANQVFYESPFGLCARELVVPSSLVMVPKSRTSLRRPAGAMAMVMESLWTSSPR